MILLADMAIILYSEKINNFKQATEESYDLLKRGNEIFNKLKLKQLISLTKLP